MPKKNEIQLETLRLQQKQLELQTQQNRVLEKGIELAEKYYSKKLERVEAPKIKWSIIGFLGILIVVVLGSGFLVYNGKMDSGSFTFLLGTLIGVSITFLGDLILPKEG